MSERSEEDSPIKNSELIFSGIADINDHLIDGKMHDMFREHGFPPQMTKQTFDEDMVASLTKRKHQVFNEIDFNDA